MSKKKMLLSLDEELIKYIKIVAVKNECTVSELVSDYIRAIKNTKGATIKAIQDINNK